MESLSILIPFRSLHSTRKRNLDYVTKFYKSIFPDAEYVICDDDDPKDFNRGRALINGIKVATGDTFILADADYIVPENSLLDAVLLSSISGFVVPYSEVAYLSQSGTVGFLKHGLFDKFRKGDVERNWQQKVVGGVNVVTRSNYFAAGGFDPKHKGWGFEDASFSMAMETLVAPVRWVEGPAVHLWHPASRNPRSPNFHPSWDHCKEYEKAKGNKEMMLQLVGDRIQ